MQFLLPQCTLQSVLKNVTTSSSLFWNTQMFTTTENMLKSPVRRSQQSNAAAWSPWNRMKQKVSVSFVSPTVTSCLSPAWEGKGNSRRAEAKSITSMTEPSCWAENLEKEKQSPVLWATLPSHDLQREPWVGFLITGTSWAVRFLASGLIRGTIWDVTRR